MSFEDLPEDWPDIPLDDPRHTADVLDIFVDMRTRHAGAILVLVCDHARRPIQPIMIDGVRGDGPKDEKNALGHMAGFVAANFPECTVIFAVARTGGLSLRDSDRRWGDRLTSAFSEAMPVLGVHVVTPHGSRLVPGSVRAA